MKLICCMTLLALVGTVSGAGYLAAEEAGMSMGSTGSGISCQGERSIFFGDICDKCRAAIEVKCSGLNWWDHLWCEWWEHMICQWTSCFI